MPLGDRYCEDERLLTYWLSTILYKEDAVMAIIAGTAYCISSFPIFSVPNAVGAFCPVIPISLFSGRKGTHFPASKQKKTRNR